MVLEVNYFQIYTDRSVLEDGSAGSGAACRPPGSAFLESCGHQLNPFLSTYSTEINAVYSAMLVVQQYSKLFNNFVILTDSLSVIQGIQAAPKLRFQQHQEILNFINYFRLQNINVEVAYVPSHCGVEGNERADRAANNAARNANGDHVVRNIGYTRREAYAILNTSTHKDYYYFPYTITYGTAKGIFPNLVPNYNILIRKLRVNRCAYKWNNYKCTCGHDINLNHLFDGCPPLSQLTENLRAFKQTHGLEVTDFINEHKHLGWLHAKVLCDTIVNSPLAFAFA